MAWETVQDALARTRAATAVLALDVKRLAALYKHCDTECDRRYAAILERLHRLDGGPEHRA